MSTSTLLQLVLAALLVVAGLVLARGQGVALTQEQAGLLVIGAGVVVMVRAINGHFDRRG
jgi:hypothetical protein